MLDFRTCCWDDEVVDLLETCDGVAQYTHEVEDDDDEEHVDGIDLLPPTVDYDAALPFLRGGIPAYNDDGSINSYWERWPELRLFPVNLFFGVDGLGNSHRIAMADKIPSASELVRLHLPLSLPRYEGNSDIIIPPGLFCYRVNRDQILVGSLLADDGSVLEWVQSLIKKAQTIQSRDPCMIQDHDNQVEREHGKFSLIAFPTSEDHSGSSSGAHIVAVLVAASLQHVLLCNSYNVLCHR